MAAVPARLLVAEVEVGRRGGELGKARGWVSLLDVAAVLVQLGQLRSGSSHETPMVGNWFDR